MTTDQPRVARLVRSLLGPGLVPWLTLSCAGLSVLAGIVANPHMGRPSVALLIAVGVIATEARPLHFASGGERRTFTFSEGTLVLGLVMSPGWMLIVGFTAGIVVTQVFRRLPAAKVAFNVSQYSAATGVAVVVALTWDGTWGAIAGLVAFSLLNEVAVQLVLLLSAGTRLSLPFADRASIWFLQTACAASISVLCAEVLSDGAVIMLVAPVVLFSHLQREALKSHVTSKVLRVIATQAVLVQPSDQRGMAYLVTSVAREVMAAGEAQILLLDGPRPLLVRDTAGVRDESRADPDWYRSDGFVRTVLDAGPSGATQDRWAGVALGPAGAPRALLTVCRSPKEEPFHSADLAMLKVLADEAAGWLAALEINLAEPADVIDLNAARTIPVQHNRRMTELLVELDVLRARLGELTHGVGAQQALGELEESQRRLTGVLSGVLGAEAREEDAHVSVGTWRVAVG